MTHPIQPTLQALLVADRIYVDKDSGKRIIVGVFQQLRVFKAPLSDAQKDTRIQKMGAVAGSPFVYGSLTDVVGEQKFDLRYVRLKDDVVIFATEITATSPDRLANVEFSLALPLLPTDPPGAYALELLWDSIPLGSYRIIVTETKIEGVESDGSA